MRESLNRPGDRMQQLYSVVMISVRDTTSGKARAAYRPVVSTPVNHVVGEADGMIVETKYAREYDQMLTPSFRLRLTDGRRGLVSIPLPLPGS